MNLDYRLDGAEHAELVVLSHSLGSNRAMWKPQVEALCSRYRVLSYDLRGHGRSDVPPGPYRMEDLGGDVLELLDRVGVQRAHLCGVSIGGMLSLWTAAHHPERVKSLISICATAALGPPSRWAERAATVEAQGTVAVADAVLERWFTPGYRGRHPEVVAAMRATLVETSRAGYAGCCRAIEHMDLTPDLAAIRAPTLAIAARGDTSIPPDHSERLSRAIPDCRFEIVDDAAHLVSFEQPERTNQLIAAHLERGG